MEVLSYADASTRLSTDLKRLQAFSRELGGVINGMIAFQKSGAPYARKYYTPLEHDRMEGLLFRYLACRRSLLDMVGFYKNYWVRFRDTESQTKGFIIGFDAALHLACYSTTAVGTFLGDQAAVDMLNEAHYRFDIPEGTYDTLFQKVTSIDNIRNLKAAWHLFSSEAKDKGSPLYRISETDPDYGRLVNQIGHLYAKWETGIRNVLEKSARFLPDVRNRLRHAEIAGLARSFRDQFKENLFAARAILFESVGRITYWKPKPIRFSAHQMQHIKRMLEPGDLLLTFTSGYMSNIFLPGKFKHAIVYVGMPDQRSAMGLRKANAPGLPKTRLRKLFKDLSKARLPSGGHADLIEAVAEGVVFGSLKQVLETRTSRLLVLRPQFTEKNRIHALFTVFQSLGNGYDFEFDFGDASLQCCTEVVYRAFHSCGAIRFPLTYRMGNPTLSADDIIEYHLSRGAGRLQFVLLAEADPASGDHRGILHTGRDGHRRLKELMGKGR
jgi:hypothetical protein